MYPLPQLLHGLLSLPRRGLRKKCTLLSLKPVPTPRAWHKALHTVYASCLQAAKDVLCVLPLLLKQRNVLTNQKQFYEEEEGESSVPIIF